MVLRSSNVKGHGAICHRFQNVCLILMIFTGTVRNLGPKFIVPIESQLVVSYFTSIVSSLTVFEICDAKIQ